MDESNRSKNMKITVTSENGLSYIFLSYPSREIYKLLLLLFIPLIVILILFPDIEFLISFLDDIVSLIMSLFLIVLWIIQIIILMVRIFIKIEYLVINSQTMEIIRDEESYKINLDSKIVLKAKHFHLNEKHPVIQIHIQDNEDSQVLCFGSNNQRSWLKEIAEKISMLLDIPFEDRSVNIPLISR